jgi:hypothetical protein
VTVGTQAVSVSPTFRELRCDAQRAGLLLKAADGTRRTGEELLRVAHALGAKPAGAYPDLRAALGATPSRRAIAAVRDVFVDSVDADLQARYRAFFAATPPAPGLRQCDRIDLLRAVEPEARAVVEARDWPWLARWLGDDDIGAVQRCLRRLSNFAFDCQRVNLRFTHHCNIACRHCYNDSGPDRKAVRLARSAMQEVIREMPEAGIPALNISGGEPFLYVDDLLALVAEGRAVGLAGISIFTNGFFARSEEQAGAVLARLCAAGFGRAPGDYLKMSIGAYHLEFIELDRAVHLARCYARMLQRRLRLDIEVPADQPSFGDELRRRLEAAGVLDAVRTFTRVIEPLGRARGLERVGTRPIDGPCQAINQIVFDPDGSARPCCGLNNDNAGVVVGQIGRERLRDLVKRMQNNPVLQFLSSRPMTALLAEAEVAPRPAYAGLCDACQHGIGALVDTEPMQARLFAGQRFYPFWFSSAGSA